MFSPPTDRHRLVPPVSGGFGGGIVVCVCVCVCVCVVFILLDDPDFLFLAFTHICICVYVNCSATCPLYTRRPPGIRLRCR